MKSIVELYDSLSDEVKNDLKDILLVHICKGYNKDIDNDTIEKIIGISNECWLHDEYTRAGVSEYAYYLLDEIYYNKFDVNNLDNVSKWDIIEAFNDNKSIKDYLKLDTNNLTYLLTTKDGNEYYSDDDGIYIANSEKIKIHKPHPMEDTTEIIFNLFKDNLVSSMPLSSHLEIRNIIKNEIYGDEELEEKYKVGIDNYKKYCKERFITSRDILRVTKSKENIDIMEEDKIFTDEEKLKRLDNVINKLSCKDINKYTYVASYESGVDFYYADNTYVAINKDNITKEFEDKDLLLLHELQLNDKFSYISEDESKKLDNAIANEINCVYEKGYQYTVSNSLAEYLKYVKNKELDSDSLNKLITSKEIVIEEKSNNNLEEKKSQKLKEIGYISL